jgi:hypothetical protein
VQPNTRPPKNSIVLNALDLPAPTTVLVFLAFLVFPLDLLPKERMPPLAPPPLRLVSPLLSLATLVLLVTMEEFVVEDPTNVVVVDLVVLLATITNNNKMAAINTTPQPLLLLLLLQMHLVDRPTTNNVDLEVPVEVDPEHLVPLDNNNNKVEEALVDIITKAALDIKVDNAVLALTTPAATLLPPLALLNKHTKFAPTMFFFFYRTSSPCSCSHVNKKKKRETEILQTFTSL